MGGVETARRGISEEFIHFYNRAINFRLNVSAQSFIFPAVEQNDD